MLSYILFNPFSMWLLFVFLFHSFLTFFCLNEFVSSLFFYSLYLFWQIEFCSLYHPFIRNNIIEKKNFLSKNIMNWTETKTCSMCIIEKHIEEFHKNYTESKICNSKRILKRYFGDKEKISTQRKTYYEKKLLQNENDW